MTTSLDELQEWIDRPNENEHLEFKEARNQFDSEKLVRYCVALANEGGGKLILGVTNALPREIVGCRAFADIEVVKHELLNRLRLRVDVEELNHSNGRVVLFHVPSRPLGMPIQHGGAYWMRSGASLV